MTGGSNRDRPGPARRYPPGSEEWRRSGAIAGPVEEAPLIEFAPSARGSLGVEWEIALVDRATHDLASRAEEVLAGLEGRPRADHVHRELLSNTVELVTDVCGTVGEVVTDLGATLEEVRGVTDGLGLELLSAGTHPFARWETQEVSAGERYATLMDRTRWWGRQMVIYGVHVHVGLPQRERVPAVLDGLLTFHPHLQALGASSPFWEEDQTGYASNRALLFQQLPTAGLPFQFRTWQEYERYVDDLMTTGVIEELKELRWDVRPAPHLGTIEVRVCDGLPTMAEVAAVTAFTQCLVVDLDERVERGEPVVTLPPWHVQENKWRTARYGTDAIIICDPENAERLVTDEIVRHVERLAPVAERLGCSAELASVLDLLATGASYRRQIAAFEAADGDLRAVTGQLVEEMRSGRPTRRA